MFSGWIKKLGKERNEKAAVMLPIRMQRSSPSWRMIGKLHPARGANKQLFVSHKNLKRVFVKTEDCFQRDLKQASLIFILFSQINVR